MKEMEKQDLIPEENPEIAEEETKESKVNMSTPWMSYYRKINSMFGSDPEIKCSYDEDNYKIELLVDNQAKADALAKILPAKKIFGNVSVDIEIKPSNDAERSISLFKTAFAGNPLVYDVIEVEGLYNNPVTYVMFNKYIVQFWNDNLGDPNGNYTVLPQDMAKEIFDDGVGVLFSTVPINE